MPTTGASASARAASRPVSSKHAMTCASAPSTSPALICSSSPGTANASSYAPSIEAGPNADETARITVSDRAALVAAAAMVRVIAAVVLGLTMFRCIGLTLFSRARDQHEPCRQGDGFEYRIGGAKANHAVSGGTDFESPGAGDSIKLASGGGDGGWDFGSCGRCIARKARAPHAGGDLFAR